MYLFLDRVNALRLLRWLPVFVAVGAASLALFVVANDTSRTHIGARATAKAESARRVDLLEGGGGEGDATKQGWLGASAQQFLGDGAGNGEAVHNTVIQQFLQFGPVGGAVISLLLLLTVLWWQRRRSEGEWLMVACGVGVMAQGV